MKCDHKYVDMEDGSLDKFCVKCSNKFKQAVAVLPLPEIKVEINLPNPRHYAMSSVLAIGDETGCSFVFTPEAIKLMHSQLQQITKGNSL